MASSPTPFELTGHDRYRIGQAREALAAAKAVDWSDGQAGPRMVGRLRVNLENLLAGFVAVSHIPRRDGLVQGQHHQPIHQARGVPDGRAL